MFITNNELDKNNYFEVFSKHPLLYVNNNSCTIYVGINTGVYMQYPGIGTCKLNKYYRRYLE